MSSQLELQKQEIHPSILKSSILGLLKKLKNNLTKKKKALLLSDIQLIHESFNEMNNIVGTPREALMETFYKVLQNLKEKIGSNKRSKLNDDDIISYCSSQIDTIILTLEPFTPTTFKERKYYDDLKDFTKSVVMALRCIINNDPV